MTDLLQNYSIASAHSSPNNVALVLDSNSLSYETVERFSNQVARAIRAAGCRRGDRVAMLLPKTPHTVASLIGILKADCAYVPIDPKSPSLRALMILESAEPGLVLADASSLPLWQELSTMSVRVRRTPMAWMESGSERPAGSAFDLDDVVSLSAEPLTFQNTGPDPAYILYTSGSTGMPKGVVITHDNVICFIEWAKRHFGIQAGDRISGHPPLYFDLSVFDVFGTFAAGAQLHLVPPDLNVAATGLCEFIRRSQLTQWFSVPSLLTYLTKFDAVRQDDFPAMQRLLWCGEVLPTPVLRYWMERLPHVTFTNLYGPTEATIASSYFTVSGLPSPEDAIPIGTACDGEELLVLDDGLHPAAPGEIGTLYIRGKGLSPGYWKDLEKTRNAFVLNPFNSDPVDRIYNTGDLARMGPDGLVYFVGRVDSQIKSRGYRIELGEIEAALHEVEGVKEAAVVAVQNGSFENNLICCVYSTAAALCPTPATVRRALQTRLPSHMLPSRWIVAEKLPRNMNGKIDRSLLKEWFQSSDSRSSQKTHPHTEVEDRNHDAAF